MGDEQDKSWLSRLRSSLSNSLIAAISALLIALAGLAIVCIKAWTNSHSSPPSSQKTIIEVRDEISKLPLAGAEVSFQPANPETGGLGAEQIEETDSNGFATFQLDHSVGSVRIGAAIFGYKENRPSNRDISNGGPITVDLSRAEPPSLIKPVNDTNELSTDIDFSWGEVPGSGGYKLFASSDRNLLPTDSGQDDCPSCEVAASKRGESAIDHRTTLHSGTNYFWEVQAQPPEGKAGHAAWSQIGHFRTPSSLPQPAPHPPSRHGDVQIAKSTSVEPIAPTSDATQWEPTTITREQSVDGKQIISDPPTVSECDKMGTMVRELNEDLHSDPHRYCGGEQVTNFELRCKTYSKDSIKVQIILVNTVNSNRSIDLDPDTQTHDGKAWWEVDLKDATNFFMGELRSTCGY